MKISTHKQHPHLSIDSIADELYKYDLKGKRLLLINDNTQTPLYKYIESTYKRGGYAHVRAVKYSEPSMFHANVIYAYDGTTTTETPLHGSGRYNSYELIDIIRDSDIIITALIYPFPNVVKYVINYGRRFIIFGDIEKLMAPQFINMFDGGIIHLGYTQRGYSHTYRWLTNMIVSPPPLPISYATPHTSRYDGEDIIYATMPRNIPKRHDGCIGVPPCFLDNYDPSKHILQGVRKDLKYKGMLLPPQLIIRLRP